MRGFTLVELIVVVGILSVMAAGAVLVLNPIGQFQKANDAKRKADLTQIQKAVETYYQDNGKYPISSISNPLYRITTPTQSGVVTVDWGSSWQPYMNVLPKDSGTSRNYVYYSTGQSYYLYASLERGASDPQVCNGGSACSSLATYAIPSTACGGICNYGVTSPNVSP